MGEAAQLVATVAAGLFAGAAIYINVGEHPARMECGVSLAVRVFGPSYRRAAIMQATLALIGSVAGLVAWQHSGGFEWLTGSIFLFLVIPYTFVVIMGTNKRLLDPGLDRNSEEALDLLVKWGRLHAVRSLAGGVSFLVFALAQ